jgi:alginate O-acetyltransferase complex protein AlgI
MLFTEPAFFAFFAAVFLLHWAVSSNGLRKLLLLVASYLFYAAWDWRFLSLIFLSTIVDFVVGIVLKKEQPILGRRTWLTLSLVTNLGVLGFFKYFNFFVASGSGLLSAMGLDPGERTLNIILPVGISFFTFQTMSYTIDVYRGKLKPISNPLDFALFVGFFPQLVAGPIVRAADFLPQLRQARRFPRIPFRSCLTLFFVGFFKKACISDNLAPIVDSVFAAPHAYGTLSIWIAVIFYAIQIYCDFSGYTDMAIATARALGFELRLNFDFPYLAGNITEFWRRWHISLSS